MNENLVTYKSTTLSRASIRFGYLLRAFFAGILIPFGFAPFHLPGLAILGIALFYAQLRGQPLKQSFLTGFAFGLGFLGLGVSWVYISIHDYGHLNPLISSGITLLFVFYLALYPALVAVMYNKLAEKSSLLSSCFIFSALWCLAEYLRSTFMSGFPWLLLGFGQIDSPLNYLLPIVGVYGVSFITCLAATFLVTSTQTLQLKRYVWLTAFVGVLLIPTILSDKQWTRISNTPISVGVIQANLSMRDKWDESLFWQLLQRYKQSAEQLMGKKKLIVMPESAIPIPASYISDIIDDMSQRAKDTGTSMLLGIPVPTSPDETYYYNTVFSLGDAHGNYLKQHLVPFGEYIPQPFAQVVRWLGIPMLNIKPGKTNQPLIQVDNHPIAALICYELAYPQILRKQLPEAEWIVSISDDGWFGHSLAMYQQLQMAQVLSLQTGRFHVVSNNDGLSSVINAQGNIIASLPASTADILEAEIYPATGSTPWTDFGDMPVLFICILVVFGALVSRFRSLLRKNV